MTPEEHDRTEPMIDPDCTAGKCSTCVGGPCEHECHGRVVVDSMPDCICQVSYVGGEGYEPDIDASCPVHGHRRSTSTTEREEAPF